MQLSTISVFYKQRNNYFFPVTSYALPTVLLRVPLSVVTGIIFTALTYFVVGFAPDVGRCRFLSTLPQHSFIALTCFIVDLLPDVGNGTLVNVDPSLASLANMCGIFHGHYLQITAGAATAQPCH